MLVRDRHVSSTMFVAAIIATFLHSVAVAQDKGEGERLFRLRCGSCHTVQAGQDRNGPTLAGVMGRRAGTVSGARYSMAMKSVDIIWDGQSLDRFLSDPRQTVPGTTMALGLRNAEERRSIIEYLTNIGASRSSSGRRQPVAAGVLGSPHPRGVASESGPDETRTY